MTDNPFRLSGFSFPGSDTDPFGLWTLTPATAGISFAVGESAPGEPQHHVGFASVAEGLAVLADRQRTLAGQQDALTRLEQHLTQITPTSGGTAFAIPGEIAPEFVEPALKLEAALQRMTEPVSYGLFDRKQQAEQAADLESTSQWRKFLDQVRDMVTNYARVQTDVAGSPIGRTTVDWTGDFRTIWIPTITPDGMTLHYHNISTTLQWRLGTLRLVGVVGAGAANIAFRLGIPGGQLLALPAVWNFVKDVLAEWRRLQALKNNEQ